MKKPQKVVVIGLDCAMPHLIERHIAEGYLPTFKALFEGGVVADNCLVPYPTITPPSWATIATGALIGTHNVTDFHVPLPGTTPENANTVQAFSSERVKAEFIWDAADKVGKKCIVLNYPGAWPSRMKNGIVVGGAGLAVVERREGFAGLASTYSLCGNQAVSTDIYPGAIRGEFEPAEDWTNLEEPGEEPLEMAVELNFPDAPEPPAPTTWYVLARQSGGDGYDRITLSPTKDLADAFCTLAVGQWSPMLTPSIEMQDGSLREVFFRCKLIELSEDAEEFRLFMTAMVDVSPWVSSPEVADKIKSAEGVPVPRVALVEYSLGLIDLDTFVECCNLYDQWVADAAVGLLKDGDWDLFFMHTHPPDYFYHGVLTDLDPATCPDEAKRARAWEAHRRVYQAEDTMIRRILDTAGNDTLVALVSDHGATADGPLVDMYRVLGASGLTTLLDEEGDVGRGRIGEMHRAMGFGVRPDTGRSKAIPQGATRVCINLKGRDPEGIVEPEDYEKVQQQIIDALLTYVHPATGTRPIALALSKRDARILGLYGDEVGDVVYALYPSFGAQHGHLLPTAEWGIGSLKALFVLNGPGVKKGARLQRTVGLQDLVPTICYLTDLPLPENVDGAVIYQALRDPNFKRKEMAKLMDGLSRMEAALARQQRQPWDKHDCA